MPGNPSEQPERQQPHPENEIDRYERLQLASERQIKNIGDAYETHSTLIEKGLKFFAASIAILVTLAGIFFFSSIREMESKANSRVEEQVAIMTNTVASKLALEANKITATIDERFKQENIGPIIEAKVQDKVDRVTDRIIEEKIHNQIDPEFANLTNKMVDVENELNEAKISSADVRGVLDLAMNIVMALNDDRNAFDKICEQRGSGTNRYDRAIYETIDTITTEEVLQDSPFVQQQLNWDFYKFNPDTNNFDAYIQLFNQVGEGSVQSLILQKLSEQARFPRYKKLGVYRDLISITPSLKVLSRTCKIVDSEAHLGLNILGKLQYLHWVNFQLSELTISNCTASISTNKNDVMSYLYRSQAYEEETNFSDALKDCEKAVSINPTNFEALNACAWLLAVCPDDSIRNGKQAVQYATKACELTNWKNWNCIGTLAAACAEAGDFENAIKYEEQAINTTGITDEAIAGEKRRIILFEQHKPTHEMPN